ncbi:unnamed protein product [Echinostoma caproni]|uniref:Uncharacterized protein n=1 Tax=Echinostoma caproni TaxID=27848 RepID=A0A3P8I9U5_9TREM|nr:unnamed protein product [Echinostoma caproni]
MHYNITLDPGPQQCIRELTDPIRGSRWQFIYSSSGLMVQLRRPQDTTFTQFQYAPDSGRLERILFPNGMVFHAEQYDALSSRSQFTRQGKLGIQNRSIGRQSEMLCRYDERTDPWSVQFVQHYPGTPSSSSRRPARLFRRIQLPDRMDQPRLINSVLWTFDRNAKVSPSSRLARHRTRRQISRSHLPSPTELSRSLQVGHTSGWSVGTSSPQHTNLVRAPRSAFSYLSSALSLSGYRTAVGAESVEWQYHKTLVVSESLSTYF